MNSHVANIDVKVVRVPESNVPYLFCHIINVNNMHSFNLKSQFLLDLLSVKGQIFFSTKFAKMRVSRLPVGSQKHMFILARLGNQFNF